MGWELEVAIDNNMILALWLGAFVSLPVEYH